MPRNTETTPHEPILELWRILALGLIVAAGMLFVHLIVPAEADVVHQPSSAVATGR